jgi:hypothetical protein
MNAKLALSSLVIATAFVGNAFAESPILSDAPFTSSKTRAEVQAELLAYRQAGVNPWAKSYQPLHHFRSSTTIDAVRADFLASRDQVRAFTSEDSGSAYLARARTPAMADTAVAGHPAAAQ